MKKRVSFIIILSLAFVYSSYAQIQYFIWQDVEREYLVRTPANHDGPLPVMFFLHGLGQQIAYCDQQYNFSQMAEDFGWAIVVPQALNLGIGTMWNAGLMNSNVDDVGFLMALLDSLTIQYQLNPDSVFFSGFSMGGFMTHRMAIMHGDRITACAPVSGLISIEDASQTPVVSVRMLHIHGTDDLVVGYSGSSPYFSPPLGLGVDAIIDYWQNANGCTGDPTIDTLPDLKNDGLLFVRYTYNCGTDLQLLKVVGGEHTWYHSSSQYDVGYKDVIYDFFTGHSITPSIPSYEAGHLKIWPNPTNGIFNVQLDETHSPEIQVFDVYGKLVGAFVGTNHFSSQQTMQIDLSNYPAGIYFLKDRNGSVAKVVVER